MTSRPAPDVTALHRLLSVMPSGPFATEIMAEVKRREDMFRRLRAEWPITVVGRSPRECAIRSVYDDLLNGYFG